MLSINAGCLVQLYLTFVYCVLLVLGCPGQEVRINGERINGLFHLLINGVYWGYNPLTNLLLTS